MDTEPVETNVTGDPSVSAQAGAFARPVADKPDSARPFLNLPAAFARSMRSARSDFLNTYIVRAGVVERPAEWAHSGYREIQGPPERYAVVDLAGLSALCGFTEVARFQQAHRQWIEAALPTDAMARDDRWSESIALGSKVFVEKVKVELGIKARYRDIGEADGTFALRESRRPYTPVFSGESDAPRSDNTLPWEKTLESTEA